VNITLSADENLIQKCREYAKKHNTSLNKLVRKYLERLVSIEEGTTRGKEFAAIAKEFAGESETGYHFNREELYDRGKDIY